MIGVLNSWLATSMNALLSWPASASSALARVKLRVGRLELGDQALALGEQLVLVGRLADGPLQLVGIPGLEDVAEDVAFVDGVDHRLDVGIAGEEHPDGVGVEAAGVAQELVARHAGHPLIGEDEVDVLAAEDLQRLVAALGRQDAVRAMELVAQALEHVLFVVDDQ